MCIFKDTNGRRSTNIDGLGRVFMVQALDWDQCRTEGNDLFYLSRCASCLGCHVSVFQLSQADL